MAMTRAGIPTLKALPPARRAGKSMRPGGGGRFAALKNKLAQKPGIQNPAAVAAAIGRKKYGKSKFQGFAAAGKKRSS